MRKKKTYKNILKVVAIITIILLSSIAGVYAERIIASSNVTYSNGTSGLTSTNVQGAIDELYTKYAKYARCAKSSENFACFLQLFDANDTVIADDGTADHNMRYMGSNPNNYITFAGEEWRVIGVFNNIDNGKGKKESRVKIIRASSIGTPSWNTSNVNIWKNASLNAELQALPYASNTMVENAMWYLGDPGGAYTYTSSQAYTIERGETVADGNDPTWIGKVGLMYPSDYGFASSACKDGAKTLNDYDASGPDCKGTDWLFGGSNEYLLSPYSSNTRSARFVEGAGGGVYSTSGVSDMAIVRPVVYLKSSIICKNCNEATAGTKENPFQIG